MKTCLKNDCLELAITRGKYCEKHRSKNKNHKKKSRTNEEFETNRSISPETFNCLMYDYDDSKQILYDKIIKDRELKMEQETEYEKTLLEDQQKLIMIESEKEFQKILEMSRQLSIEEKRKNILLDSEDDYFNIKFKLPNGESKKKFSRYAKINDIRNYIDIYFIDNNIRIENYNLVMQYPLKKITKDDNDSEIQKITNEKSFILFIQNLD